MDRWLPDKRPIAKNPNVLRAGYNSVQCHVNVAKKYNKAEEEGMYKMGDFHSDDPKNTGGD
jgi:arabinogalactan endo-1,4-beta-galactosidase